MKLIVTFIFFCLFLHSTAQNTYRFQNYSLNQGLSQSVVTSIIQDNVGTLWIGTQDGLNRFDGQFFENFSSDNCSAIKNDYFNTALKGKNHQLWFGTANGLVAYDTRKEIFTSYSSSNRVLQIVSLAEEKNGSIWIATSNNGINVLAKGTKEITRYPSTIPSNKISFLHFENEESLLVGTEDAGLYRVNIRTNKTTTIEFNKYNTTIQVNVIRKLNEYSFIIGTNVGLFQLNFGTNTAQQFLKTFYHEFGEVEITDINVVSENTMFISTLSQGIIVAKKDKNYRVKYNQLTHDRFNESSISDNNINVLFKDHSSTYWVGTNKGIASFDPFNAGFYGISTSQHLENGLTSPNVWCFEEDKAQKFIYIGTDNAVSRLNKSTGKFDHYSMLSTAASEKNEIATLAIRKINANQLLVGTTNGLMILTIQPKSYHFEIINFSNLKNSSYHEKVYSIAHWKENLFFIGTRSGVLLFNTTTKEIIPFDNSNPNKANNFTGEVCRYIYKDHTGQIWFTSSNGGLYQLREHNSKLYIEASKYNTLIATKTRDYITTILQTEPSVYWLGTMGSGVIKLNTSKMTAQVYNKKNGLPNKVVYGILNDSESGLWFSTNKGLSNFNWKNFNNFTEMDGLMSNEFNQNAYLQTKSGEFYFGGINGYNFFNPKKLSNRNKTVGVNFVKFKLDGDWIIPSEDKKGVISKSISTTTNLNLGYRQRNFTLKVIATDLSNPKLISYKYTLEGSDDGEVFLGNFNQIHFTNLSPGTYTLKVYARIGNGEWSKSPRILEIYVAAPFWLTWWFWIIFTCIIALIIVVYIRKRIDNERREQVRLEMKIAERTREIREQKFEIEVQNKTIEDKNLKLQEQKTLLENEKTKTEKLLRNIIPQSTYEELKTKGKASARAYSTVSVMFTDFVGFTKISEKLTPTEIVNELDIYFRKFDEIIVANNLEKIKTIGDAYMCAGGVPVRNNTNPIDTCLAALQIQESMKQMRKEAKKEGRIIWNLRLGINTGEVTAGVIGSKKLAYDIWGSTVNKAHRMEMLGEANKVTISGETFKYIEPYFTCTFKGKAKSKTNDLINMYTVDGIKPDLSEDGKGIYPNQKFKEIVNLHFYSSINYYKAERHIIRELEKRLSPKLHYHSIAHTKDVCDAIERLALAEGITDEGLFLLKSAATYHDAGFVEKYEKNEPIGARMAEEILPQYGYSPAHIERIKELIFVTQIPHQPKNHLEEIMCDADLDYLGRDDFHEIADRLRLELREYGKLTSDRAWDETQVKFLNMHKYFTKTAKASRDQKKASNLAEIEARLIANNYKD